MLFHILGLDNAAGPWYLWWSGAGSDLGELAAAAAFLIGTWLTYQKHVCHVRGCWRVGRLAAGPYTVCHRHHPDGEPTHADVLAAHRERA